MRLEKLISSEIIESPEPGVKEAFVHFFKSNTFDCLIEHIIFDHGHTKFKTRNYLISEKETGRKVGFGIVFENKKEYFILKVRENGDFEYVSRESVGKHKRKDTYIQRRINPQVVCESLVFVSSHKFSRK